MKTNQLFGKTAVATLLLSTVVLSSCDKKTTEPTPDTTATSGYSLIASVGDKEYTLTTNDITTGKLTVVGKGIETASYGSAFSIGGYMYQQDFNTKTFNQYKATASGLEKISSLSNTALTPQGGWRNISSPEAGKLLLMTWPDEKAVTDYAIVKIPEFTVEKKGSFTVAKFEGFDAVEIGGPGVVADGKIYLGTMFSNVGTWDKFPDKLVTLRYDYPSFANPTVLTSTASLGDVAQYTDRSMVADEKGDIYQQNIRSKHWYNMGTAQDKPTVFTRIRNGQYDNSYVFNISEKFTERVSLIGFTYVGNGIAYGRMHYEDQAREWDDAASANKTAVVKIDLYNKTVTKLNLPLAPYIRAVNWTVQNGKLFIPVSPVGSPAFVYEVDPTKGADGFTKGAELDGSNVQFNSIFKN